MAPVDLSALPLERMLAREWLAVNKQGGFAASTVAGLNTRKYHGLLVAAMAPPVRRMVILSRVEETVFHHGKPYALACNEYPGTIHPQGHRFLRAFDADPFPRWAYQGEGWTIEKQLRLVHGQNTVCLSYVLLGGDEGIDLELQPLFALRPIHELMYQWNAPLAAEAALPSAADRALPSAADGSTGQHRLPATGHTPEAFFAHDGRFHAGGLWYLNTIYRHEQERGYAGLEDLWMPGTVRWALHPGQSVHFVCSTEPIVLDRAIREAARSYEPEDRPVRWVAVNAQGDTCSSRGDPSRADPTRQRLERAADQFVLEIPAAKTLLAATAKASPAAPVAGRQTLILSAYPWAAPALPSALIALPGLLLVTGRLDSARSLLQYLAGMLEDGLLPSELPEDGSAPIYAGPETALWFAHAGYQYLRYRRHDAPTQRLIYQMLARIISAYRHSSPPLRPDAPVRVAVDDDGLIVTGPASPAGNGPVAPRRGCTVGLNALWYNALCIGAELAGQLGDAGASAQWSALARQVKSAFNQRFWNDSARCCFDVVQERPAGAGPNPLRDASVRPNQILAVGLPFAVLDMDRQRQVLDKLRAELLTPMGLRTLTPRDPAYEGHCRGDALARDHAAQQGSAYPWLLGIMVTATLKVLGRGQAARRQALELIQGPLDYLQHEGMGQIPELFDGDPPHTPGGATASALAAGELLRCYVQDILDQPASALEAGRSCGELVVPPIPADHGL